MTIKVIVVYASSLTLKAAIVAQRVDKKRG